MSNCQSNPPKEGLRISTSLVYSKKIPITDFKLTDYTRRGTFEYDIIPKYKNQSEAEIMGYEQSKRLLESYISTTSKEWHGSLFLNSAPPFDLIRYGGGRYKGEKIRVLSSLQFLYDDIEYEVFKTFLYEKPESKGINKLFILTKKENRWYFVSEINSGVLRNFFKKISKIDTQWLEPIFRSSFLKTNPRAKIPESLVELINFSKDDIRGNKLNLSRFVYLLDKWESENDLSKLNQIYNEDEK